MGKFDYVSEWKDRFTLVSIMAIMGIWVFSDMTKHWLKRKSLITEFDKATGYIKWNRCTTVLLWVDQSFSVRLKYIFVQAKGQFTLTENDTAQGE